MILETLENASRHEALHPSFPRAFGWLRAFDPSTPDGRYEIDGQGSVAIVSRYSTAPASEKKWETHRVHGDIQYMVCGAERIGHGRREDCVVRIPYDPAKDAEFYLPPEEPVTRLLLREGSLAIFFPEDAHQPGVMEGAPEEVLKVVVKFVL